MNRLLLIITSFTFALNAHCQNISTIAGNGVNGYTGDGGPATSAAIAGPGDVIYDKYGNLYIAASSNTIRKVTPSGTISTVAGMGTAGFSGDGGAATSAQFNGVSSICFDTSGNMYATDYYNNRIRKIDKSGMIYTIAGTGIGGFSGDGGPATSANLYTPQGIAVDTFGNIYFSDRTNYRVRKINASGSISTIAGTGVQGTSGDGGLATSAQVYDAQGIALSDDYSKLYIADETRIRMIDLTSGIISTIAGSLSAGFSGDGGPAASATMSRPLDVSVKAGELFFSDENNNRIRKISASGIITTVAGNGGTAFSGDGGPATAAEIYSPRGITLDICGNLILCDNGHLRVRKVTYSTTGTTPAITITASPNDTVCAGTTVTYTATVTGAGATGYQWYVNGEITGATSATYSYTPSNGDSIRATFTGNEICNGALVWANSNSINMVVQPLLTPTVTISSVSSAAVGSTVTVNAVVSGAGGSYNIKWFNNGVQFAATATPSVTYTKGSATDTITARVVSTTPGCYDSARSNRQIIQLALAVEQVGKASPVHVYPNPATTAIYIQGQVQYYRIISPVGMVVQEGPLQYGTNSVPVGELPTGLYMLDVVGDQQLHTMMKLNKR